MRRNPLVPFALIAVLGIGLMFLLSFQGLDQAKELAGAAENGGKTEQTVSDNPEDIAKQTCAGCHGGNLEGGVGPSLQKVGGKYSADDIKGIILNGQGTMPAGLLPADQAAKVAEWLAEKK